MIIVGVVVVLVLLAFGLFRIGLMAWHFLRGDVQLEAGGSWGKQVLRRSRDERLDDPG